MKIPVSLRRNADGGFYAKTLAPPDCNAEGRTRDETLQNIKDEIRYRLEFSACAFLKDNDIAIDVREDASQFISPESS
jgi:predicted RNase H-like HicB family nuclease